MNRRISTLTLLAGVVLGVTGAWVAQGAAAGLPRTQPRPDRWSAPPTSSTWRQSGPVPR